MTKIIRDHYYAQDLTQNVFANIYFKRKQIGVPPSFKFYLYKALKNQSIDWIRKNRRIKEVNIDMFTFSFEQAEVDDSIQNLKHLLKEEDYQLIILRFYYGFKFKEIAEIMNITAGNARIRCSRLKWKLRGLKNEEK
ncbi:sigma-70 family RNA polymerase sigma factor [Pediococcus ethanolidurans]|nr:sigma-70 family RNA polymerase sigma factor [Pediococcus ethanolidurans]